MILTALCLITLMPDPVRPGLDRFVVDAARSEVGFHGTSTLHDFTGRTHAISGEVRSDLSGPETITTGRIRIEAGTLDTDNSGRDEKMHAFLDVEHFPYIEFMIRSATGAVVDRAGALEVTGSFRIHGVERERSVQLTMTPVGETGIRLQGSCRFDMTDHGIDPPTVLVITVGKEVEVFVDLVLMPVEGDQIPARSYPVTVTERLEPVGGEPEEHGRSDLLWVHDGGSVWMQDSESVWTVGDAAGARAFDLEGDRPLPIRVGAEAAFLEARQRLARLETKLGSLGRVRRGDRGYRVKQVVERLREGMSLAPGDGPATVERTEGATTVELGGSTWVRAEGRVGDGDFAPLLLTLEGLPDEVRAALAGLHGVPERLVVRTVVPTGVRKLDFHFGPPSPGHLPVWATTPASWIGVEGGPTR